MELGIERDANNILDIIGESKVFITDVTLDKVKQCREYLENKISEGKPIYGVSTGFGILANKWISHDELGKLQVNLIRSHAAGLGDEIPIDITRTAMKLLVNSLAKGHSGIRVETIQLLIDMINNDVIPVTYKIGSLGASGDLATLAHLALVLIGEGEVWHDGDKIKGIEGLNRYNLKPVELHAKEGLALINGTHFITAYALHLFDKVKTMIDHNILGTSLSLEATRGTSAAYSDKIAGLRKHPGHSLIASKLRDTLDGSNILKSHIKMEIDHKVQDPYVFRCVPQVLGAVVDALEYLKITIVREINSVTDNPLIFVEDDMIISGGNFHAEPLAFPLENIGMALVEIGNISEKRINRLVHPQTPELPAFLAVNSGVESGYMITHYTVAALLNRARVLSHPAVTDNISVSGSQEDHVSMGMGSAQKSLEIAELVEQIIALEIYLAVRGLNLQDRPRSSDRLEKVIKIVNETVPFIREEHYTREKMVAAIELIKSGKLLD